MPCVMKSLGLAVACMTTGAAGFATPSSPSFASNHRQCRKPSSLFYSIARQNKIDSTIGIDIDEEADRNILAFDALWSSANGIQRHDGFKLTEADQRRGVTREVYATTAMDVNSGTPVLFVPEQMILSSNKAVAELRTPEMASMVEPRVFNEVPTVPESEFRHYYLMLKILLEVQNGKDSPWYLWLNSLPRYFTNAVAMTEFCLTCLPPLMKKMATEEREAQERMDNYNAVRLVPFIGDAVKNHHRDLVKWAYQIVYTRAVEGPDGDLQIVPMADYFNHGSIYTEINAQYDANGNYYGVASYDIPAGSALRIQYADPRNPSHLLARYGFLDEDCPATYCKLLPPTVNQDMLDLGYSYDKMLFYKNGEIADEVWDIFLYQILSETDFQGIQMLMNAHRSGDYDTKSALHKKHYEQTSAAILEHIDSFIKEIDELIKMAESVGVNDPNSAYISIEHPRLPLIHRHNLFLRETFLNIRDLYKPPSQDGEMSWRDATRVTVQECDENECEIAECVQTFNGEWTCMGGLGDRPKTQTIIEAHKDF